MRTIRSMALGAIVAAALGQPAAAQDKVKVGVFPTASSLPYFVAIERGFFKELNIDPETIRLIGGPPNIAAMISNQIEAAVVLVTIEAMNANLKKPGVAMYIGVHSQSKIYQMEQFVVRTGYPAAAIKDLKGARIMSAPGPANLVAAKAILAKVGLKEGDYTMDQLDISQHVNVMTSGTFDAGYTLEPQASTMRKLGVARTLEAGVIAKYILGDEDGNAFAAGCAITSDFIKSRPTSTRRSSRNSSTSRPRSARCRSESTSQNTCRCIDSDRRWYCLASLPGLTRQSITLLKSFPQKIDARVKPAHADCRSTRARCRRARASRIPGDKRGRTCSARRMRSAPPSGRSCRRRECR